MSECGICKSYDVEPPDLICGDCCKDIKIESLTQQVAVCREALVGIRAELDDRSPEEKAGYNQIVRLGAKFTRVRKITTEALSKIEQEKP
jgi:hypothetical protein